MSDEHTDTILPRGLGDSTWTRLRRQFERGRIWRRQIAQLQRSLRESREAVRRLYLEKERGILLAQKHQRDAQDAECIARQWLQCCKALLEECQWGTEGMCPMCKAIGGEMNSAGAVAQDPHAPDCEWAALLAELP